MASASRSCAWVGTPLFGHTLFPVYVAAVLWGGSVLRNPRLRAVLIRGS